ncbi:MAG: Molybdopterin synthase catalytic subunit MoaE [Candidatus Alkanophagales archaeon MCA70_species_1]|nr:Molybdopterin synthase catalytic subunit MoaE [Candidatus Alkanophaga volatiphilum]
MKVASIVGRRKVGKTTLIERLVSELRRYGRVAYIKHAQELDVPGKDTHRILEAGASVVVGVEIEGDRVMRVERKKELKELLQELEAQGFDFVLVEGFKSSELPKILVGEFEENVRGVVAKIGSKDVQEDAKVRDILEFFLSSEVFEMGLMEEKRCRDEGGR